MWDRRTLVVPWLIVISALACGGQAAAPGPLAAVTKVAAKTSPADIAFDAFLSDLNLQKTYLGRADEIQAQLWASRMSVNAKVKSVHLMSYSARQGVPHAGETNAIMPLIFASTLADALDPVTSGRTTGGQTPSAPLTSTSDGPTTTTTTSLNITTHLSGAGSKVTLTMFWTYHETTVDKATGAKLVDLSDERTIVGTIDVCPGTSGVSPATIDVHIQLSASTDRGTSTRSSTSSNTFSGHVDDQAVLRRVTQDVQLQTSWQNDSGSGGYDVNLTNANWQASESGVGSGLDSNGVGGSLTSRGAATAGQATNDAGKMMAVDLVAIEPAYNQAQKLWRNGRCVVVQVPDYNAETPLSMSQQSSVQHDEEVELSSVTKFGVNLRHRFAGALNQAVKGSLSGEKKLEPMDLNAVPNSLSYSAPGEQDKQATVTLKSTSKRGIGTLAISFHTKGRHLTLTAEGTGASTDQNPISFNVTIGPAEFHKVNDTTWEAVAPTKGTGRWPNPYMPECDILINETGTATLVAHIETRADKSFWVVHLDQARSGAQLNESTCAGVSVSVPMPTGGWALIALKVVGDVEIPIDGGTVTVHESGLVGGAKAQMTFTGTVKTS